MTIKGSTFDLMRVKSAEDALMRNVLGGGTSRIVTGYKKNLKVTAQGLNAYISTGAALIRGRLIEVTEQELVTVNANTKGYICLIIDLTKVNTVTGTPGTANYKVTNNQVSVGVVTKLVQSDINGTGTLYTFPIAEYTSTGSSMSLKKYNNTFHVMTYTAPFKTYNSYSGILVNDLNGNVTFNGVVSVTADVPMPNLTEVEVGWIPDHLAPLVQQTVPCVGSSINRFAIHIHPTGRVTLSRHTPGVKLATVSVGNWLNMNTSYTRKDILQAELKAHW